MLQFIRNIVMEEAINIQSSNTLFMLVDMSKDKIIDHAPSKENCIKGNTHHTGKQIISPSVQLIFVVRHKYNQGI